MFHSFMDCTPLKLVISSAQHTRNQNNREKCTGVTKELASFACLYGKRKPTACSQHCVNIKEYKAPDLAAAAVFAISVFCICKQRLGKVYLSFFLSSFKIICCYAIYSNPKSVLEGTTGLSLLLLDSYCHVRFT